MRLDDLHDRALRRMQPEVAEHFDQGAGAGLTVGEAAAAWDRLRLRPRILRDVSSVSTAASVLGHHLETPVLVAPTAMQRAAHPDGEVGTARAAAAAGSLIEVSTNSGSRFADIGATGSPWWLQVYVLRDRGLTRAILDRAVAAGASALVLTVDTPIVGRKRNTGKTIWEVVPEEFLLVNVEDARVAADGLDKADDLTPDVIGWLREATGLPVVVKGVLRADDARAVVSAGASAVQVSNHGGRQLDLAISTAEALPEIAAELAGSGAEVYVDGGIRQAEHVLAALALGANGVFIGRPVLWALAAGGPSEQGGSDGVLALLNEFTDELGHVMKLAGARSISEITPDLVRPPDSAASSR